MQGILPPSSTEIRIGYCTFSLRIFLAIVTDHKIEPPTSLHMYEAFIFSLNFQRGRLGVS